jgi:hypothetical protein
MELQNANPIFLQTSLDPLLYSSNVNTPSWRKKTKISSEGEKKSTIQITLMDHNMCKIKIVYIRMFQQNLQRKIL